MRYTEGSNTLLPRVPVPCSTRVNRICVAYGLPQAGLLRHGLTTIAGGTDRDRRRVAARRAGEDAEADDAAVGQPAGGLGLPVQVLRPPDDGAVRRDGVGRAAMAAERPQVLDHTAGRPAHRALIALRVH